MRLRSVAALVAVAAFGLAPVAGATVPFHGLLRASAATQVAGPDPTLVVTFADRPRLAAARARLAGLGVVQPLVPAAGVWVVRGSAPATARSRALTRSGVVYAEWSLMRRTFALTDPPPPVPPTLPLLSAPEPTDSLYTDPARSWHLRTGTWATGLTARPHPSIAVLDSGLALTHEEWSAPGVVAFPHTEFPARSDVEDIETGGHGTHVTGIAAAPANGVGVVGVAPATAQSPVMPVQINDRDGVTSDAAMMAGIRWAVEHGAKVINISSGGRGGLAAFQEVVNWAFGHGVLIVAAVGNGGLDVPPGQTTDLEFPAAYAHVVGVAAQCNGVTSRRFGCDAPFARARFSDVNGSVDVIAPGVEVASTLPARVRKDAIASGYGLMTGTSMAAPFVAGAAALVSAAHPGISPFQVTRLLEATATRGAAGLARTDAEGWGFVNPLAAAQATAAPDDLGEPNDDTTRKVKSQTLTLGVEPVVLNAWADANDDPFDVYAVNLAKGDRVRLTTSAEGGVMRPYVFRPGVTSVQRISERQFRTKLLLMARRATPGTRAILIRAREAGRHWIVINAERAGGPYTLTITPLARG